jgi:hypothetical protein
MGLSKEFERRLCDRSTFHIVIQPNWLFGMKKIEGSQWTYMRFRTETLLRQREERNELNLYIHLLGDEQSMRYFPDWFLETFQTWYLNSAFRVFRKDPNT